MFFLHTWEYFISLWTLDQKCTFPFILTDPGLLRMLKRNSENAIITVWVSYFKCLDLITLLLGKAILQVNFALLLLQNNGHVASVGKKNDLNPFTLLIFGKKATKKTCSYRKLADLWDMRNHALFITFATNTTSSFWPW